MGNHCNIRFDDREEYSAMKYRGKDDFKYRTERPPIFNPEGNRVSVSEYQNRFCNKRTINK